MNDIDLTIDSNFILNKLVFALVKDKRLYLDLNAELQQMFNSLYKIGIFRRIHIVADSNKPSWRKNIYDGYKSTRKKDITIDWKYVFDVFYNFIENQKNISKQYRVYMLDNIEADDIIATIVTSNNKNGISNFIISNDHDIKQLLYVDIERNTINIMANEIKSKNQMVFLPFDYKVYLDYNRNFNANREIDLFDFDNMRNDDKAYFIVSKYISYKNINLVYSDKSFFIKLISGDKSDNINSVYILNNRGIGEKGAEKIYENYVKQYGVPIFRNNISENIEIFENIADCVIEAKKVASTDADKIIDNCKFNFNLINLKELPENIANRISSIINSNMVANITENNFDF